MFRNSHGIKSRCSILFSLIIFLINFVILPPSIQAQSQLNLPEPGDIPLSGEPYTPAMLRGITLNTEDPFRLDFIVDMGDSVLTDEALKEESMKLVKYFLAALTVPENEMWVNLSPYEKDRIIPQGFGQTEMGRDLLAQDYVLKQLSASLLYPKNETGSAFWERVYAKAMELYGTTALPMNTFNKVWIVPKEANIYEHEKGAYVVSSHLNVMLEEDYLALENNKDNTQHGLGDVSAKDLKSVSDVSMQVLRDLILPEIEKEINESETFANLRQIYNSMILAVWYKNALKESLLSKVYANQNKTDGINTDTQANQEIYDKYVDAFKKGAFDIIKEGYNPDSQKIVHRKYFSGGAVGPTMSTLIDADMRAIRNAVTSPTFGRQTDVKVNLDARTTQGTGRFSNQPTVQFTATPRLAQGLATAQTEALESNTARFSPASLRSTLRQSLETDQRPSQMPEIQRLGRRDPGLMDTMDSLSDETAQRVTQASIETARPIRNMLQRAAQPATTPAETRVVFAASSLGAEARTQGMTRIAPIVAAFETEAAAPSFNADRFGRTLTQSGITNTGVRRMAMDLGQQIHTAASTPQARQTLVRTAVAPALKEMETATPQQVTFTRAMAGDFAVDVMRTTAPTSPVDFGRVTSAIQETVAAAPRNYPSARDNLSKSLESAGITNPTTRQRAIQMVDRMRAATQDRVVNTAVTEVDLGVNRAQTRRAQTIAQTAVKDSRLLIELDRDFASTTTTTRQDLTRPTVTALTQIALSSPRGTADDTITMFKEAQTAVSKATQSGRLSSLSPVQKVHLITGVVAQERDRAEAATPIAPTFGPRVSLDNARLTALIGETIDRGPSAVNETIARGQVETAKGGIDLNPATMVINIDGDGGQVIIPISDETLASLDVRGLTPEIVTISPIDNLLPTLGINN